MLSAFGLQSAGGWPQARPHTHAQAKYTKSSVFLTDSSFWDFDWSGPSSSPCPCSRPRSSSRSNERHEVRAGKESMCFRERRQLADSGPKKLSSVLALSACVSCSMSASVRPSGGCGGCGRKCDFVEKHDGLSHDSRGLGRMAEMASVSLGVPGREHLAGDSGVEAATDWSLRDMASGLGRSTSGRGAEGERT
jgi:hypothetical protein